MWKSPSPTSASWLLWSHLHLPSNCCWCLTLGGEIFDQNVAIFRGLAPCSKDPSLQWGEEYGLGLDRSKTPSGTPPYSLSIFLACWRYSLGIFAAGRSTALTVARDPSDNGLGSMISLSALLAPTPPPVRPLLRLQQALGCENQAQNLAACVPAPTLTAPTGVSSQRNGLFLSLIGENSWCPNDLIF